MTITARYASTCAACHGHISAGESINWSKGGPTTHARCGSASGSTPTRQSGPSRSYYGARPGQKRCITGGQCSSFGDGRSCGGYDCNGY